jgi:tol-pal system protein YbgF
MRRSTTTSLAVLALVATPAVVAPAVAQSANPQAQLTQVDKRVSVLESQMRAVQRQVFPGGDKRFFEPEIGPAPVAEAPLPGTAATPALVDLTQRVTALETQQRALTGQVEQMQYQMRQLESALHKLKGDSEFRLDALEGKSPAGVPTTTTEAGAPAVVAATPPRPGATAPASPRPTTPAASAATASSAAAPAATTPAAATPADAAEARYREGYALYTGGDFAGAHKALSSFVAANPKHARASNAQFWAGRALLSQGKTADAAKAFLAGYQQFPRGERAHNSLLWLGKSLIELKQPAAACQALDQLKTAYPDRLTGQFAADNAATRAQAKCGS